MGAVVAGSLNIDNGVAAAAEAVEAEQVLQQRLNLYAFCVLLEVVGSGLGGCNTQSAFCFAAIKPGFETVQGDMFFICGKQGFDVFKLQAGSLNGADLKVGLNVGQPGFGQQGRKTERRLGFQVF